MIRVGIIGMGIRGTMYAKTLKYNAYAEVAAFAEGNPERLKDAKAAFGATAYSDYNVMLAENDFDIVIVALPDHLHKDAVLKTVAKKCHILIEKPLSTS
ncbi:MAG TPA: Gfo/Idh/MocA family oxidoreductase [Spirochaetia bacterium]|nr:Gfo/Idh/MocA family oxidoreductase [Spirochaetia bacterium]